MYTNTYNINCYLYCKYSVYFNTIYKLYMLLYLILHYHTGDFKKKVHGKWKENIKIRNINFVSQPNSSQFVRDDRILMLHT